MYVIPENYWAAELSNGQKIVEDEKTGEKSAWLRLRDYLNNNKEVRIEKLHLHAYGRDIYLNNSGIGFFHSKSIEVLLGENYEKKRYAIGHVKNNLATISWINPDGKIQEEVRKISVDSLSIIS